MAWIDDHIAALRALIERLDTADRRMVEEDIRRRRIDADIAALFINELPRVLRTGITAQEFCRRLGHGQSYQRMRLRVQLEGHWDRYVRLRREAGDSGRYGLDYAIELLAGEPAEPIDVPTDSRGQEPQPVRKRYWGSPQSVIDLATRLIGRFNDMCPYPLPPGFDALAMDRWPAPASYVNAPFSRSDELHGRSLTDWARKAVEQHKRFGTAIAMWAPVSTWVNVLLKAGAEVFPLGRLGYVDVDTGEPHPSPGESALFVLPNATS